MVDFSRLAHLLGPKAWHPYEHMDFSTLRANALALARYLSLRVRFPNLDARLFFMSSGYDLRIDPEAHVRLGHGVQFMREFTGHFCGTISIGDGVFFNRGCSVYALESLIIGDHSLFGERVSIHNEQGRGPMYSKGVVTAPIVIGRNVWVGAKATSCKASRLATAR